MLDLRKRITRVRVAEDVSVPGENVTALEWMAEKVKVEEIQAAREATESLLGIVTALTLDPEEIGAKRGRNGYVDGETNYEAIQVAAEAMDALGGTLTLKGDYEVILPRDEADIPIPLTIRCYLEGSTGKLWVNDGDVETVIRVGSTSSRVRRRSFYLPALHNEAKTTTGWSQVAGSRGIEVANCYTCYIVVNHTRNFETGLRLAAYGINGCVYNTIMVGHLDNNKVGIHLEPADANGWVNENKAIGGWTSIEAAEGSNIAGARHVLIGPGANGVNNNIVQGLSLESNGPEYHVEICGPYTWLLYCRWEASPPKVLLNGVGANSGAILYGYNAHQIVFTMINGASSSTLHRWARSGSWLPSGGQGHVFVNTASGNAPAITIMPTGSEITTNQVTDWAVQLAANHLSGKRQADAYARLRLDHVNGRVYLGPGTIDPIAYISPIGSTVNLGLSGGLALSGQTAIVARAGTGTPNGAVAGNPGSPYYDGDGKLWKKKSGSGTNTGWVEMAEVP